MPLLFALGLGNFSREEMEAAEEEMRRGECSDAYVLTCKSAAVRHKLQLHQPRHSLASFQMPFI